MISSLFQRTPDLGWTWVQSCAFFLLDRQIMLLYCLMIYISWSIFCPLLCPTMSNSSTSKTKLLMISPPRNNYFVPYSPIFINGETIYLEQAKHVSVLRFTQGNGPYTLNNNFQECLVVYLGGVGQTQPPQSKYSHQKIMS